VYGCAGRRQYLLGQSSACIRSAQVGPVAVEGALAAYALERCGVDTGSSEVIVRSLTNGHQLKAARATTKPVGPESYVTVRSVVIKADGAVAWIALASSLLAHRRDTEVHKSDQHGQRLLDSGGGIDPGSLRLHGSKLTWRDGGGKRSATLS
jgi:hypothetical protein